MAKQSSQLTPFYQRYIELSFKVRDGEATILEQAEFYSLQARFIRPQPLEE